MDIISKMEKLVNLYHQGYFGGTQHEVYPKLDKGSKKNYLYFTLAPAINYQRNSENLWKSALATYEDKSTNFVFHPEIVSKTGRSKVQAALTKHKLALQRNKQTDIWITICKSLNKSYQDNPKVLLESCDYDVSKVISLLQENKKSFPYLSGTKLSNYWLYILSYYTDVKLKNKEEISVIPDTHIIQATQHLGLVSEKDLNSTAVATIWRDLLHKSKFAPSDIHAPLWRWSRNNFEPKL